MFFESMFGCIIVLSVLANLSATLYNGYRTRKSADEQRRKQEEFQIRIQQKQWRENTDFQREMRKLSTKDANYTQDRNLLHQKWLSDMKSMSSAWPLLVDPICQLKRFSEIRMKCQVLPLQIFMVEDASLTIPAYKDFYERFRTTEQMIVQKMNETFNRNDEFPVELYTQSLKYPATFFGVSHIANIHSAYSDVPTVIIWTRLSQGMIVMECAYWGWGSISAPQFCHLLQVDICEFKLYQLRKLLCNPNRDYVLSEELTQALTEIDKYDSKEIFKKNNRKLSDFEHRIFVKHNLKEQYDTAIGYVSDIGDDELFSLLENVLLSWSMVVSETYYAVTKNKSPFSCLRFCNEETANRARELFKTLKDCNNFTKLHSDILIDVARSYCVNYGVMKTSSAIFGRLVD